MADKEELSLADELGKALDEATETAEPIEASAEVTVESTEPSEPVAATDGAAKPEANADAAKEATPDTQTADAKSLVTPPATWSASGKAVFASLPEAARKEIAKREQDYARGIQQHAEAAKGYQNLMREFQPYEAMIRSENGSPEGAIRELLKTAYALRTGSPQDRGQLVMQIAHQFGADITPFTGQQAHQEQSAGQQDYLPQVQSMVQQLVAPHLQRIQSWEQQQATAQQQQAQQQEQAITSQIEAFQNATAEDGVSPKHVYFENVRGLMSAYFSSGQAQSLDQAYEMACWANPEVRAAMQSDMQRTAEAHRLEEVKRKAAIAKNASFNVSGQGGTGIAGATQSSLRDELASQLDSAMGGARL